MTMKLISSTVGLNKDTKPMNEMLDGEVAYILESGKTVLCVSMPPQEDIYMILGDNDTVNGHRADCTLEVRPLSEGEKITITFSN